MAEAPVLTKKQLKASLSAKKSKTKDIIKNSLYTPFKQFWPCINEDHSKSLIAILDHYLPKLLPEKIKVPWTELKKVSRRKRKQTRQRLLKNAILSERGSLERQPINRDGLILGVNDVSKALENGRASHVLLSADIEPRLMVQHIIDQAILNRVPILVVPELRKIIKRNCGITSIALAFTNNDKFSFLQTIIEEMSAIYPAPENHIHYNRIKIDDTNSTTHLISNKDVECNINERCTDTVQDTNMNEPKDFESSETSSNSQYLIRSDKEKRVFVPEEKNVCEIAMESQDFLTFKDATELYKPVQIRRSKQDRNRFKNKIKALKRMKKPDLKKFV